MGLTGNTIRLIACAAVVGAVTIASATAIASPTAAPSAASVSSPEFAKRAQAGYERACRQPVAAWKVSTCRIAQGALDDLTRPSSSRARLQRETDCLGLGEDRFVPQDCKYNNGADPGFAFNNGMLLPQPRAIIRRGRPGVSPKLIRQLLAEQRKLDRLGQRRGSNRLEEEARKPKRRPVRNALLGCAIIGGFSMGIDTLFALLDGKLTREEVGDVFKTAAKDCLLGTFLGTVTGPRLSVHPQ